MARVEEALGEAYTEPAARRARLHRVRAVAIAPDPYVLGHSDQELRRLADQARAIAPITRRFLRAAGIGPGMRVLDVGSGVGDVAFLAAELVGGGGQVIGSDRSDTAVAAAQKTAAERALTNVTFRLGDPAEMAFERAVRRGRWPLRLAVPAAP